MGSFRLREASINFRRSRSKEKMDEDPITAVPYRKSFHAVKALVFLVIILHLGLFGLAVALVITGFRSSSDRHLIAAAMTVALGACVRIIWVVGAGLTQAATAVTMTAENYGPEASRVPQVSGSAKTKRRMWYKRWLWWGRFSVLVSFIQVSGSAYVTYVAIKGSDSYTKFVEYLLIVISAAAWTLAIAQCCIGSAVLSWRSLYEAQNDAWRAHYREIFDYGIRELLCCLGRSRYMSARDEDEVDSVAALLGDLVAYRAAGASHLEILAGIALLQKREERQPEPIDYPLAPSMLVKEAAVLHPYAVAAYTGPLLDIGRNPLLFPCVWLYRQGIFTLWNRNRWPIVEGDNWWRGHAAAFLKAAELPPEALRQGRIHQKNRETVYFVVILRELKTVLVTIRGTETPEDLLTDGLGRECQLSEHDLQGLLSNNIMSSQKKDYLVTTMPHFGHGGVVAAAKELVFELDNIPEGNVSSASSKTRTLLATLLASGGECDGYSLRFVGHSLGGSIAAVAGMMLYHRYPSLHVYAYGLLPCVDSVIAEACSDFVTSLVYNDEFAPRLSVASVMRLRTASLQALANTEANSLVISKLAKHIFHPWKPSQLENQHGGQTESKVCQTWGRRQKHVHHEFKGATFLCYHACNCMLCMSKDSGVTRVEIIDKQLHQTDNVEGNSQENGDSISGQICNIHDEKILPLDANTENHISEENCHGCNPVCCSKDIYKCQGSYGDADEGTVSMDAGVREHHITSDEVESLIDCDISRQQHADVTGEISQSSEPELLENGMPKDLGDNLDVGEDIQQMWPAEMFIPGLVIHLLRDRADTWSWKKSLGIQKVPKENHHTAVLKDRECFRDIVVSPSMFLDHMPWRCQHALNDVLNQVIKGDPGGSPDDEV